MRVSIDDFKAFMTTRDSSKAGQKKFQQGATIAVAKRAQTVVDHPGWQTYLDHLSAFRDKAGAAKEALLQRLEQGTFAEGELTPMLRQLQTLRGEIQAYTIAIDLVPNLVKSGQDAQQAESSDSGRVEAAGRPQSLNPLSTA